MSCIKSHMFRLDSEFTFKVVKAQHSLPTAYTFQGYAMVWLWQVEHICVFFSVSVWNYPFFCLYRALDSGQCVVKRSDIKLLSPLLAPEKVVCVGMNYRDHCIEQNAPIPKEPIIFSKFPSAITGPYDDIMLPSESQVTALKNSEKPHLLYGSLEQRKSGVLNVKMWSVLLLARR